MARRDSYRSESTIAYIHYSALQKLLAVLGVRAAQELESRVVAEKSDGKDRTIF